MKKKINLLWYLLYIVGLTLTLDFLFGLFFIPRSFSFFRTLHPYYHHGLLSDQQGIAAWGPLVYPISTNSLGFRDSRIRKVPLKVNQKRILFMGDSHTEAVGVNYEDSFFGKLNSIAKARNIDILNASAVSYSPKIHFLKTKFLLEHEGLKFDELWVFIDLSDLQNELAYEKFVPQDESFIWNAENRFKKFMIAHSFIYSSIYRYKDARKVNAFYNAMTEFDEKNKSTKATNVIELYSTFFKDFDDKDLIRNPAFHGVGTWYYDSATIRLAEKGLALGQQNITRLAELCRQNKIRMKLSVHPWQTQVSRHDTTDYYVDSWRKYCEKEGIDFINLFPVFINDENPEIVIKRCYIPKDNHWSETGHEMVARFLDKYLH